SAGALGTSCMPAMRGQTMPMTNPASAISPTRPNLTDSSLGTSILTGSRRSVTVCQLQLTRRLLAHRARMENQARPPPPPFARGRNLRMRLGTKPGSAHKSLETEARSGRIALGPGDAGLSAMQTQVSEQES